MQVRTQPDGVVRRYCHRNVVVVGGGAVAEDAAAEGAAVAAATATTTTTRVAFDFLPSLKAWPDYFPALLSDLERRVACAVFFFYACPVGDAAFTVGSR